MAEGDGLQAALEIILLRIAIEKSLVAQAQFIRQQASQKILKPFAVFVVPRMITSAKEVFYTPGLIRSLGYHLKSMILGWGANFSLP